MGETDCKIVHHFFNLKWIIVFSLEMSSRDNKLNFRPKFERKNIFFQGKNEERKLGTCRKIRSFTLTFGSNESSWLDEFNNVHLVCPFAIKPEKIGLEVTELEQVCPNVIFQKTGVQPNKFPLRCHLGMRRIPFLYINTINNTPLLEQDIPRYQ